MAQNSDLLYAVLALQMGFISKDQMVEAGAVWASNPKRSLPAIFAAKGFLEPDAKAALDALVKAKIKQCGDPGKSLAALPMDEDVRKSLLALPLGDAVKGTLLELKARPPAAPVETVVLTKAREERYLLGAEIGRGGLGRVSEAKDTVLGREVAVKEMIRGTNDAGLLKRFLREGEIAGRLMHPNIVPVFDVGVREEQGRKTPYFAMGRIHGRDLKEILRAVEAGEGNARHEFGRPRLLRIFQDVCLAVLPHHHVGRFQIAMDDSLIVGVGNGDGVGEREPGQTALAGYG